MLTRLGVVRWRRVIAGGLVCCLGLAGLVVYLFGGSAWLGGDPVFRGKRESEWISSIKELDHAEVERWRGFGEEGVQVLMRGLDRAKVPGERAYRSFYNNPRLPSLLRRWLPFPKPDSTRVTRLLIVTLLGELEMNAMSATELIIDTVLDDVNADVRSAAIIFFTKTEDENCLLNQLPKDEKKALLEGLIRAIQDNGHYGLRNNGALALRFYPEERQVIEQFLVKALQDPEPSVQLCAVESLMQVAPETARSPSTTEVLVKISRHPDDQHAIRAIAALRKSRAEPHLAMPALIAALQHTNSQVPSTAVWALGEASEEFYTYGKTIIPALRKAAERSDYLQRRVKFALEKWEATAKRKEMGESFRIEGPNPL